MVMKTTCILLIHSLTAVSLSALADGPQRGTSDQPQDGKDAAASGGSWTRALDDRGKRGTLHDQYQFVRGDTGRWNDEAQLQPAPPIEQKPARMPLDDWFEQTLEKKFRTTAGGDNWLLFRTAQLNDNDRVWVERIERRGNEFAITLSLAEWQGRYSKNFTGYHVFGVNLGKLEPGKYKAKWIVKPLAFSKFEDPGRPQDNWPKDEQPADEEPTGFTAELTVVAAAE
jgi:hypothetical protein